MGVETYSLIICSKGRLNGHFLFLDWVVCRKKLRNVETPNDFKLVNEIQWL